ncbi:MAG: LuxR C-terminal-related transcriptional regulator [Parachlamydia sp.]|nr:LuxR C-terminal-related transcriptional regulator [Parachlamydia sp.]
MPLLRKFTRVFRERHQKLFELLYDNQVNIAAHFGPVFYVVPKRMGLPVAREEFLCKIGMQWIYSLTPREKDILNLLSKGYPASFIALQLKLSPRTVENYMVNLKDKLSCSCKAELIQRANDYVSLHI